MMRAIATAEKHPRLVRTQESYNKIVLRAADHGLRAGWIVYFVASTTDPAVIPVGRHFRFDVSANGKRVIRSRASHRGVIEGRRDVGPDRQLAGMTSSSVYDARPTEFQMYVSTYWRLLLGMLGCDGSMWTINGMDVQRSETALGSRKCINPWRD